MDKVYLIALLLSSSLSADITIQNMAYNPVTDNLEVTVLFPGKCMEHEVRFVKIKGDENRYRLMLSNQNDPCNAVTKQIATLNLSDITFRPTKILVSPHSDGSKAHEIVIPEHPQAIIHNVKSLSNGQLEFVLAFRGPAKPNRFYIDSNEHDAVVRDKLGQQFLQKSLTTKKIVLTPAQLAHRQTVVFVGKNAQRMSVYLP